MPHARTQHPNAPLTPEGRRRMVACVLDQHWTIEATADRFQVDAKTVRKWRDRFVAEGDGRSAGSQRRVRIGHRTGPAPTLRQRVLQLRRRHRWGADHIAHETGLAASTVQRILNAAGCGRLDRGDRAEPRAGAPLPARPARRADPRRRQEDQPRSPTVAAGGCTAAAPTNYKRAPSVGYRYIHSAIDDRTRLVYSEIHARRDKPSPPSGSGTAPWPGSPPTASPANGCSPTTAPATSRLWQPRPAPRPARP